MEKQNFNSAIKFRGIIQSNNSYYYIINEILDFADLKSFTASKFQIENGERTFDNKKYLIRFIAIEWIKANIFNRFNFSKLCEQNFFNNLQENCKFIKEKIKSNEIQKLHDCIIDERGIFIVLDYYDISLREYLGQLKEPIRNFKSFPFEVKIRRILTQILNGIIYIHNERNLFFGALLNPYDIMIQQEESENYSDDEKRSGNVVIKLPNPFMSDIFTVFYINESKNNNYFPSYLAPEIFSEFEISRNKKYTYEFGNLISKISQNSDMWSLGYLVYEMIFVDEIYLFENSKTAILSLDEKFTYDICTPKISKLALAIIIKCLQLNVSYRMDSILLNRIKVNLERENDNLEAIELMLKKNINTMEKENSLGLNKFDMVSDNGYNFRDL